MDMYNDVPLGNSIYQIKTFGIKESPERTYRHCALQLHQKYNIMKECGFRRKRHMIDIDEITEKLKKATGYEAERLQVDLEEKEYYLNNEIKLINDCLVEIATYKSILASLPQYNRQEFEEAEPAYWENKLISDARREYVANGTISVGTIESLERIGIILEKNEKNHIVYRKEEKNGLLCLDKKD